MIAAKPLSRLWHSILKRPCTGLAVCLVLPIPLLAAEMLRPAIAFEACEGKNANEELLSDALDMSRRNTPAIYRAVNRSISVELSNDEALPFPLARQKGEKRLIVVPDGFATLSCKFVHATFLNHERTNDPGLRQEAAHAAQCLQHQFSLLSCLKAMANSLSSHYASQYESQKEKTKKLIIDMSRASLSDILMHEYAHHYLNHFARLRSGEISRQTAEFEADLFAVLQGVREHGYSTTMYYIFHPLDNISAFTKLLDSPEYESMTCRARNINAIAAFIGLDHYMLFAALANNMTGMTRQQFESYAAERFAGAPPLMPRGTCDKLSAQLLRQAYDEMKALYARFATDSDLLFGASNNGKENITKARALIADLRQFDATSTYNKGLGEDLISRLILLWGQKGRPITPLLSSAAGP